MYTKEFIELRENTFCGRRRNGLLFFVVIAPINKVDFLDVEMSKLEFIILIEIIFFSRCHPKDRVTQDIFAHNVAIMRLKDITIFDNFKQKVSIFQPG